MSSSATQLEVKLANALRQAILAKKIETVKSLLENEDTPHFRDKDGNRPLHLAAKVNHPEITALLLQDGLGKAHESRGDKNKANKTPIQLATSPDVILEFAKYPTDMKDTYEYGFALLDAIDSNQNDVAIALLKSGAKDTWYKKYRGEQYRHHAMHLAILKDNLPIFQKLLEYGFDPDKKPKIQEKTFESPFELARILDNIKFVLAIPRIVRIIETELKECKKELDDYTKKWRGINHSKRARTLLDELNLLNSLENKKEEFFKKFKSMIDIANNAFSLDEVIPINHDVPRYHFSQPPKNYKKDEYNTIIEKYQSNLKKHFEYIGLKEDKAGWVKMRSSSSSPTPARKLPEKKEEELGLELQPLKFFDRLAPKSVSDVGDLAPGTKTSTLTNKTGGS